MSNLIRVLTPLARAFYALGACCFIGWGANAHAQAANWFVDDSALPNGAGTSWQTAFDSLDSALAVVIPGDVIWVAEGTYFPSVQVTPGDPRSVSFRIPTAIQIYGGFAGNEQFFSQRAGLFSSTVLSGDVGLPAWPHDNAYNVVRVSNDDFTIDGFAIVQGHAKGAVTRGGGIRAKFTGGPGVFFPHITVANCVFTDNQAAQKGGAIYADTAFLKVSECSFLKNAGRDGGAIYGQTLLDAPIYNCDFAFNEARKGGAVAFASIPGGAEPTIQFMNCIFTGNLATKGGAAFLFGGLASSRATWTNCSFSGNEAFNFGGAIHVAAAAAATLENCILWGDSAPTAPEINGAATVNYTDIKGGWPGTGNLSIDPLFSDPLLHLSPASPARESGDTARVPPNRGCLDGQPSNVQTPIDLDGAPRVVGIVDMGAYEYQDM